MTALPARSTSARDRRRRPCTLRLFSSARSYRQRCNRTPRLRAGAEFLPHSNQTTTDFAVRLATELDRTTLAIQGPPGSGKTYVGARMIRALIRAGKKVGVTAVSHKVIRNLLDAVLEQETEEQNEFGAGVPHTTPGTGHLEPVLELKGVGPGLQARPMVRLGD